MLQQLRDRMSGPFVWVIVGIIVVPFAFFGIETLRTGGGDPAAIKVDGQKITESQVRRGTEQRMQQLQQLMGDNFRQDMIDTPRFRQAVVDDMVQEMVMRQHAEEAGYRASDASVFEAIAAVPAFQVNGVFSTEAYRARLSQMGYTVQKFESQLRDSLVIDQVREGILDSGFVTETAASQAYRLEQQQRELAYALFETSHYLPTAQVSAEDIAARYEQRKSSYRAPERIRLQYLELALADLTDDAVPGTEVLRAIYESEKASRFSTTEERRASHILVNFGADKTESRKKIAQLAGMVSKGSDFSSLAGSQSDDSGSKSKGGDLGWIKRGQMLEKFETALFDLKQGQVSEPVETEFGWHLIKLEELRAARVKPFEDAQVQGELTRLYQQRDAERRYREMLDKLEQLAFESPASLEPVAKALALTLKESEWITRTTAEGLFANPALREAAFATDVLGNGENSKPLAAGDNRVVVVRKQAYEAPRQKPLEEVSDEIREQLRLEVANRQAQADAAAAVKLLAEGGATAQVARDKGVDFKAPALVARNAPGVDSRILDALFALPRPADSTARWTSVTLANGSTAVVGLIRVVDGDFAAAPDAVRAGQLARLREAEAGAEFLAYRADLQKRTKVERFEAPAAELPAAAPDSGEPTP